MYLRKKVGKVGKNPQSIGITGFFVATFTFKSGRLPTQKWAFSLFASNFELTINFFEAKQQKAQK